MKEISMFNEMMLKEGYSNKTVQVYENHVTRFLKVVEPPYYDLCIQKYVDSMTGITSNYQNQVVSAIRIFFRLVYQREIPLKRVRVELEEPIVLTSDEVETLLATEMSSRMRLIIHLAYYSGLKVKEIVALKKNSIHVRRKEINLTKRSTILTDSSLKAYKKYLKHQSASQWVFQGQKVDAHISIRAIQREFSELLYRANLPRKYQINHLRQSFAQHLLEKGIDLESVSYLLGHKSIKSTERYCKNRKVDLKKVASILSK